MTQHRWPGRRWLELFLDHPVLRPFGERCIWASYAPPSEPSPARGESASSPHSIFRALGDGTLTDADDEIVSLDDDAPVGLVHPLDLDAGTIAEWREHLADYEIEPPFPQLDRSIARRDPADAAHRSTARFEACSLSALTFHGRAARLGWRRGAVADAGYVSTYWRRFGAAGLDAFVVVDGMYVTPDTDSVVEVGKAFFVAAGSVSTASDPHDAPQHERDERLVAFGNVPPVVYSEAIGDLERITQGADRV